MISFSLLPWSMRAIYLLITSGFGVCRSGIDHRIMYPMVTQTPFSGACANINLKLEI